MSKELLYRAVLHALEFLGVFREDKEKMEEKQHQRELLAGALVEETKVPSTLAFMVAWQHHESHGSLRIQEGICFKHECDTHNGVARARSGFQLHQNNMSDELWGKMVGIEYTREQVRQAYPRANWALHECRMRKDEEAVRTAWRVLGGLRCDQPLGGPNGEDVRTQTYNKVLVAINEYVRTHRHDKSQNP